MLIRRKKPNISGREMGIMVMTLLITITLCALPVTAAVCDPVTTPDGTLYGIAGTIDPTTIPQFEWSLNTQFPPFGAPPVWVPESSDSEGDHYTVSVTEFQQQILPPSCPLKTTVFGYGSKAKFPDGTTFDFLANTPAGTFEAKKGTAVEVKWVNELTGNSLVAVDPTLHWADPNEICSLNQAKTECVAKDPANITCMYDPAGPMCMPMLACYPNCPGFPPGISLAQYPVPIVTHLHGAEVRSTSDGGPEQWFTSTGNKGADYATEEPTDANAAVYRYPNGQLPTTLFYHDHALGMTRINVLSGLAGFYLIRDGTPEDDVENLIADPKYEVPLAIQDRIFRTDGSLWFYGKDEAINPDVHPYWVPEFFGNTIMVNGFVWPKMDVDQTRYRLRFVDGSNARFYTAQFVQENGTPLHFFQIGTDGGYLANPVDRTDFTFAPGERVDILIDFTGVVGNVTMTNSARFPFPDGDVPVAGLDGTIMRFDVGTTVVPSPALTISTTLNTILPDFAGATPAVTRNQVLVEIMNMNPLPGFGGPVEVLLNGQKWAGVLRETPTPGTIEEWRFIDTTGDTHPMHTHLTQFQLVGRQQFDPIYLDDWKAKQYTDCPVNLQPCGTLNPALKSDPMMAPPPWPLNYSPLDLDVTPYLIPGTLVGPDNNEMGWKDTVRSNPGEVTTIRVRYANQDGTGTAPNFYPFDATLGPGYVWHCHIIDHEDNEMMRRYELINPLEVCKVNSADVPLPGWNFTVNGITQTTGGDGCTKFSGLIPNSYLVSEELKPDWMNITPLARQVTIEGGVISSITFENAKNSTLEVCKVNETGKPLGEWTFNLAGNTIIGSQTKTQTTDATGCTNFTGLVKGSFTVTEVLKDLWINETPLTQSVSLGEDEHKQMTFTNRFMDVWCGKEVSFWKTEIMKFQKNNPPQSREVCPAFFNNTVLTAIGKSNWTDVYNALKDGKTDPCQAKADAQKLALMLDQQYYDDGLKFRVDTSLMANDDPCKATLKSACGGKTQCSVISIFNSWPSNCKTAQAVGQCLGTYKFGCQGTNFPPNFCSVG